MWTLFCLDFTLFKDVLFQHKISSANDKKCKKLTIVKCRTIDKQK